MSKYFENTLFTRVKAKSIGSSGVSENKRGAPNLLSNYGV